MKIPKSFKLFGNTITVEFNNDKCSKEDAYGLALFKEDKIILSKVATGEKITKTNIECTFLHEMLHFILIRLGHNELSDNEKLVKQISSLLQQYLTTQKF